MSVTDGGGGLYGMDAFGSGEAPLRLILPSMSLAGETLSGGETLTGGKAWLGGSRRLSLRGALGGLSFLRTFDVFSGSGKPVLGSVTLVVSTTSICVDRVISAVEVEGWEFSESVRFGVAGYTVSSSLTSWTNEVFMCTSPKIVWL